MGEPCAGQDSVGNVHVEWAGKWLARRGHRIAAASQQQWARQRSMFWSAHRELHA